jgi:hypothetical protein
MSSLPVVIALVVLAVVAAYWLDALRAQELARAAGREVCKNTEVQFLDDSVVLAKLRLRRDDQGRIVIYREYRFEFTRDGYTRSRGQVTMMGRRVLALSLSP